MSKWIIRLTLLVMCLVAVPYRCPAPLVYRPGEGWSYEPVGGAKWERTKAKDQLEVAQEAFDKKDYRLALKAARRVVKRWPFSDYAPKAQYIVSRCYEARHWDEKAFKEYQKLVEKYPKVGNYSEVVQRQFDIANRFLNGQWFRIFWGRIPLYKSMDKTVKLYESLIKSGPYSALAPQAQMNIGAAREKQKDYHKAAKAYEVASDRYFDQPKVASEALYKSGNAYLKQAKKAEYDQSVAGKAIASFSDFKTLYPEDPRTTEVGNKISALKSEQARGCYLVARYYEKHKRWKAAEIYYNEVVVRDPDSKLAAEARLKIEELQSRHPGIKPKN